MKNWNYSQALWQPFPPKVSQLPTCLHKGCTGRGPGRELLLRVIGMRLLWEPSQVINGLKGRVPTSSLRIEPQSYCTVPICPSAASLHFHISHLFKWALSLWDQILLSINVVGLTSIRSLSCSSFVCLFLIFIVSPVRYGFHRYLGHYLFFLPGHTVLSNDLQNNLPLLLEALVPSSLSLLYWAF